MYDLIKWISIKDLTYKVIDLNVNLFVIPNIQCKNSIKFFLLLLFPQPALVQLKKQINEEVHKHMGQKLSEEEALEQVQ